MIVFFSKHPGIKPTQGMHQRILAIDEIFQDARRLYIHLSFFKNLRAKKYLVSEGVFQYELNFFIHFILVLNLCKESSVIYIHTVINALKANFFIKNKKSILDLHGVVPEECRLNKEFIKMLAFSFAEYVAVKRSTYVVSVTSTMMRHIECKYSKLNLEGIILPIFDDIDFDSNMKGNDDRIRVIYAGGVQKWQNIDDMLEFSFNMASDRINFKFMVPEVNVHEIMKRIPESKKEFIHVVNGSKEEVYKNLKNSDFGFLLRDDVLINNVACPTKAIEYIALGVVPLVKNKYCIGDFHKYGVKMVEINEFNEYASMNCFNDEILNNLNSYRELRNDTMNSIRYLRKIYENSNC